MSVIPSTTIAFGSDAFGAPFTPLGSGLIPCALQSALPVMDSSGNLLDAISAAFVVDSKIEDHYKDTIRGICETIRRAEDFAK